MDTLLAYAQRIAKAMKGDEWEFEVTEAQAELPAGWLMLQVTFGEAAAKYHTMTSIAFRRTGIKQFDEAMCYMEIRRLMRNYAISKEIRSRIQQQVSNYF